MQRSIARVLELSLVVCVAAVGCVGDGDAMDPQGSLAELDGDEAAPSGTAAAPAGGDCQGTPGAAGIGDPYFPGSGNGGYDVDSYHLRVTYDPATDELEGEATVVANATQDLSRFDMDLDGLTVDAIEVEHAGATWTREGGELVITPAACIPTHTPFRAVIRYHGIPEPVTTGPLASGGFVPTDDGVVVAGEPQVAAKWFPVNDHPRDAALYTLDITAPADLDVVVNARLVDRQTHGGWTTWRWRAREPMAPYLLGWVMGHFAVDAYRKQGLSFVDAIDVDLFTPPVVPVSGDHVALSRAADLSYKRITRAIAVPPSGGELSFHVNRDTEPDFDYFFVEAHPVGSDAWTTLPDLDGFAQQSVGLCFLPFFHPFVLHYLTPNPDGDPQEPCLPSGLTGDWWAASGKSQGWELWRVDLSRYAGEDVEVSLTYASDNVVQEFGVVIDDIATATGEGTTSFEDGDTGGWQVPGAPPPSTVNQNDWTVAGVGALPRSVGEIARKTLARQGDILAFEASVFGPYPFRDAGAIVHDSPDISFALENQARPIYSDGFFSEADPGTSGVVHELAHQWFGDRVRLDSWQHTWLNEGFATYAEWLWADSEGTPIELIFDSFYAIEGDSTFWQLLVGDPGPDDSFDFPVYGRGAMTLHVLRRTVGDEAFFRILQSWASSAHTATTAEFIDLAERISGQELDELFDAWLFTPFKPVLEPPRTPPSPAAEGDAAARARAAALVRSTARRARHRR
ncbi:MAG TPA: M1 family metallopeptidase [Kofleriaceae bacterium]|nr:M1 family metallopeptidase [Kofleriaceae bacterium]